VPEIFKEAVFHTSCKKAIRSLLVYNIVVLGLFYTKLWILLEKRPDLNQNYLSESAGESSFNFIISDSLETG
jgi:hypothetical protein